MKKNRLFLRYGMVLALLVFLSACSLIPANSTESNETDENIVGMENPAAVYCEDLGYTMESVQRNGGEDADCVFTDGSRCGQWDFLSGRCGNELTYCEMQGGTIEVGDNILTCHFSDGSSCDEYQFFLGNCAAGNNPGEVSEDVALPEEDLVTAEEHVVEIRNFTDARDFLAAYILTQYGIEPTEPWMEENITPENAGPSSTYRYVSGPLTIVITAEAAAPYAPMYTINEASYIANGFYWEGTLGFDGAITEAIVYPPGTVLNTEQARDVVLEHLANTYALYMVGDWTDEGYSHTDDPTSTLSWKTFTSAPWVVKVEFEPAAPLVAKYHVTVENTSKSIRWEGDISLHGEIAEISFSQ